MATEKRKRLAPTRETLRELYLKSGNRCAYPNCKKSLFNNKGIFVAQICHIEAAESGGERFNKNQSNEECRSSANLLLMCYDHHVETDDVKIFTVERMQRIKAEHEQKYSDVIGTMLLTVVDHTKLTKPSTAETLERMNSLLNWGLNKSELSEAVDELREMTERLSRIPIPSRQLFLVLVERGKKGGFGVDLALEIPEVQQATGLSNKELRECFSILDGNRFTFDNDRNDFGVEVVGVSSLDSGWPIWVDIRQYCKMEGIELSNFIINLDFSILD